MVRWAFLVLAGCGFSKQLAVTGDDMQVTADANGNGSNDARDDGSTAMVIDLPATADTFLRQQFPTELHGGDVNQRCGSGDPANCCTNRAVYRFDLTALPGTCTIAKAELRSYYYAQDYSDRSPMLGAHRLTSDWVELQASWNSRASGTGWNTSGGDFEPTAVATVVATAGAYGWLAWDVTTLAQAWHAATVPNYGVIVVEPNDVNGADRGRKFFHTRETSTTANRPHLRVSCQ